MNWDIETILDQSISQIASGKARRESCLLAYIVILFSVFVIFGARYANRHIEDNIRLRLKAARQKRRLDNLLRRRDFHLSSTLLGYVSWDRQEIIREWRQ